MISHSQEDFSPIVGFVTLSALIAQTWDVLIYLTDEVEFIWRGRFNAIKAIYLLSRYLVFFSELVYFGLVFHPKHGVLISSPPCPKTWIFRLCVSQLAETLLEAILYIRVYALYNKSRKAKMILLSAFGITTGLEFIGVTYMAHDFATLTECTFHAPDKTGMAYVGIGAGISHSLIFIMTMTIFIVGKRNGWPRTPLTSLMLREGVAAFFVITGVLATDIAFELIRNAKVTDTHALWIWVMTVISITTSRLVLNMRKLYSRRNDLHGSATTGEEFIGTENSVCLTTILHDE
ncbi:hypothetical protein D9613_010452 [Agrocybe pediades]|uniref:DUF6533 domain-containing protein n=1 Tax=Agrocybe pediades TaxID=84607 RepID=A0A8H4QFS8_9AGAR|nr:hypothetical protein D9613_010452 [Agrocybe pediades]